MQPNTATPVHDITAVILAGGQARRMGGVDKGLLTLHGQPLIERIISLIQPQVGSIIISANRNHDRYREFGYPVIADRLEGYAGPLAGFATGMQEADTPLIVTVPCDAPCVPDVLIEKLYHALEQEQVDISVAHDGERMQQAFALLRCSLLPALITYLESGERRVDTWYSQQRMALTDFSAYPDSLVNLNTPEEFDLLEARYNNQVHA